MTEFNAFFGATRRTPRPTGAEPAYRHQTRRFLARDQRLWDAAEDDRCSEQDMRKDLDSAIQLRRTPAGETEVGVSLFGHWARSPHQVATEAPVGNREARDTPREVAPAPETFRRSAERPGGSS